MPATAEGVATKPVQRYDASEMKRLFTVKEANALLPAIRPRIAELMAIRQRIHARQPALAQVVNTQPRANGGNRAASDTVADLDRFERLIGEINELGCLLKDINMGLIDFPAEMGDRLVYLCWQYGEDEVEWWHDLETGYAGRRPL